MLTSFLAESSLSAEWNAAPIERYPRYTRASMNAYHLMLATLVDIICLCLPYAKKQGKIILRVLQKLNGTYPMVDIDDWFTYFRFREFKTSLASLLDDNLR